MTKLLIIGGSTGTGKSDIAIRIAKRINGEIISADSMQIYKKMNIGTAKITQEDMQGIPHYMIDILNPNENFSACEYKKQATIVLNDILKRGKTPIIAGGTGLYINSILYDMSFSGEYDERLREELKNELESKGKESLFKKLTELNPDAASKLHINDTKRVIRAIEKALTGGNFESDLDNPIYPYKLYVLNANREKLYQRLNTRVDAMLAAGLKNEIDNLIQEGIDFNCQSMQAIAYKEWNLKNQGLTEDSIIELIKKNTRNYAKRQGTWFRKYKNAIVINTDDKTKDEIAQEILDDYMED